MMDRTPLATSTLSANAQRALGPGPGRMMAARGLLPLPPYDQLAVLYQLSLDADESLAQTARATAAGLPEKLLTGTLADPNIDPRVLDLFGELAADKPAVFDVVLLNNATADETMASLASRAGAREVDLIAQNEQRLLRHPEIIAAMYMNRRARMSTIDRVIELAVRNQVRVPGLAAWDEIARSLMGGSGDDENVFDAVVAERDDSALTTGDAEEAPTDEELEPPDVDNTPFRRLKSVAAKIRAATLGNAMVRSDAIRDPNRSVALAAIKAPGVTDIEAKRYAGNHLLNEDVIRYIASKREWTKIYGVKVSLCRNPKTPIPEVTRLLPFLRPRDLEMLSKSKGVPAAVVAQARKLHMARSSAGKGPGRR
jgi:hypothetical protein